MKLTKKQIVPLIISVAIILIVKGITYLFWELFPNETAATFLDKTTSNNYIAPKIKTHTSNISTSTIVDSVLYPPYIIKLAGAKPDSIHRQDNMVLFHSDEIFHCISKSSILMLHSLCLNDSDLNVFDFPENLTTFAKNIFHIGEIELKQPELTDENFRELTYLQYNQGLNIPNSHTILKTSHQNYTSYQFGVPEEDSICNIHVIFQSSPSIEFFLSTSNIDHPNWNQKSIDAIIGSIRLQ